jgi:TRAP transporter TAXI family solute receptor
MLPSLPAIPRVLKRLSIIVLSCAALSPAALVAADDVKLPRVIAWTAYNLGTTGYNQAVAIGKVLKDRHAVTLRVIPGKNDISRLLPLKKGRVQFSANGVATYLAQEGVFQFADDKWGPQPLRVVMMSNGFSNQSVAVTEDSGITEWSQLKGKRIPWVRGAPALNLSTEAILACGNVGWDDVIRVDYPGYDAMWNGIVDGQIDAAYATTVSGPTRKLEASPQGISWPILAHDDEACWQRVLAKAPYFSQHMATRGTGITAEAPHEGATYPYPILITLADQDDAMTYNLARAIDEGFDDFKDADPGAIGWDINSQRFDWVVPWHAGAVQYFQSRGVWTPAMTLHNQRLIERQGVLQAAWQDMLGLGLDDDEDEEFKNTWLQLRTQRLQAAGFDPVWIGKAGL